MCGENQGVLLGLSAAGGSSPRVRGKLTIILDGQQGERLIPACAGKTLPARRPERRLQAHPRVCGENRRPPPSRPVGRWLIPACAGKTLKGFSYI